MYLRLLPALALLILASPTLAQDRLTEPRTADGREGATMLMLDEAPTAATALVDTALLDVEDEGGVSRFRVNTNGHVGIGLTNPDRPLALRGIGGSSELLSLHGSDGVLRWHVNLLHGGINMSESGLADRRLYLPTGGGLLSVGAIESGNIPVEGPGVRMMWYPAKAAFRAGRAQSSEWDESNVGMYSAALGYETTASGALSTAMGLQTTASGLGSVAMGRETSATGLSATAMGQLTVASGYLSTAMGFWTTASSWFSTAMGEGTTAQAYGSLVIGSYNVVTGNQISWVASDPLFVAGNGTSTARSNALTLLKNGNLTIAGTLSQSSDARLKEDVTAYEGALASVVALRPVRYRFRAGTQRPGGHQIGLLAQQVQEVLPELVREDADGYLSVSYANLTPVLAAAVQELHAEVEALRVENEALRMVATSHEALQRVTAENVELRGRIAALETAQAVGAARLAAIEKALAVGEAPSVTFTAAYD